MTQEGESSYRSTAILAVCCTPILGVRATGGTPVLRASHRRDARATCGPRAGRPCYGGVLRRLLIQGATGLEPDLLIDNPQENDRMCIGG